MTAAQLLAWLMDDAFRGRGLEQSNEAQSLMANLATVDAVVWRARPTGATRTIEAIATHVAACKVMYTDYAFGGARLRWDDPEVAPWRPGEAPMPEVLAWLDQRHDALMRHVVALSDDDLMGLRTANWGPQVETRWLLSTLLQHDLYHAGEINHIRSVLSGDDRWRFQQLGFG